MRTLSKVLFGAALLALGGFSGVALAQETVDHEHEHAVLGQLEGSRILPPLGHHGWHLQIVEVAATEAGFTPSTISVRGGEPIVLVFSNTSDQEHHFHIVGLEPQDLSWFMMSEHHLEALDRDLLFAAERADDHICSSVTGICRLGINVHLHADPQSFDSVMFTAPVSGAFEVTCPLHPELVAVFAVE